MRIITERNFERGACYAVRASVVFAVFLLSGCLRSDDDDSRCAETACGPAALRQGLLPLAVGNSWTLRAEGPVDSFTVTVTSWDSATLYEGGGGSHGVWWDVNLARHAGNDSRLFEWFAPAYWRRDDSVYQRQNAMGGGFVSALTYLVPPGNDTVTWHSTLGSDVGITISAARLSESVTVPAGTYDACVAYSYGGAAGLERVVLCEGVGWVLVEGEGRRYRLVSALIKP